MSDPTLLNADSMVSIEIFYWIIGGLLGIICIVAGSFVRVEFARVWKRVNKNEKDIEDHSDNTKAHGIGELSIQINQQSKDISEIKNDNKKSAEDRHQRDKELFDEISGVKTMIYDHLISQSSS